MGTERRTLLPVDSEPERDLRQTTVASTSGDFTRLRFDSSIFVSTWRGESRVAVSRERVFLSSEGCSLQSKLPRFTRCPTRQLSAETHPPRGAVAGITRSRCFKTRLHRPGGKK